MILDATSLRALSYYQTGGEAKVIYAPRNEDELGEALRAITKDKRPFFSLGAGTNSLVMDEVWPGAVLCFHRMQGLRVEDTRIWSEAGVDNSDLARTALDQGLAGIAWMYRLPGQIGGSVRMNARCYGGEVGERVKEVTAFTYQGERRKYPGNKETFVGYKNTIFMREPLIVSSVEWQLARGEKAPIQEKMKACEDDRVSKGQFQYPSCGCVFKNDYAPEVSVSSGMLLERAGAKGLVYKGAEVSDAHCNFVFNRGATSRAIIELSLQMRETVWAQFGVWLEYEVEFLGAMPSDLAKRVKEVRKPKYQLDRLAAVRDDFNRKRKG